MEAARKVMEEYGDTFRALAESEKADRVSESPLSDPLGPSLMDDLRKMRDFCHARHLRGVNCDEVLARVEALEVEVVRLSVVLADRELLDQQQRTRS